MSRTKEKELIKQYQNNPDDYETINTLIQNYRLAAKRLAYDIHHMKKHLGSFSSDELYAIAISSVHLAANKFNTDSKSEFYPYWKAVATNEINAYINKNSFHSQGGVLIDDEYIEEEVGALNEQYDIIYDRKNKRYISSLSHEILSSDGKTFGLTKDENSIIKLYLEGYEFSEISSLLKLKKSTVYGRYHRAIEKIKKFYLK